MLHSLSRTPIRICIRREREPKKREETEAEKPFEPVRLHRVKAWKNQLSIEWIKSKLKAKKRRRRRRMNGKSKWQKRKEEDDNDEETFESKRPNKRNRTNKWVVLSWRRNEYSIYNLVTLSERHVISLVLFFLLLLLFFVVIFIFFACV